MNELVRACREEVRVPFRRNNFRREAGRPWYARLLYAFAVPVAVGWIALAIGLNIFVPQLEGVITRHAQSFLPDQASSVQAIAKQGEYFGGKGTNNFVYVLYEANSPLGDDVHRYHTELMNRLTADKQHVISTLDLWSDPDLASANTSADGKSAYVLVNLAGNMGTALAMESTTAVRDLVDRFPPPDGTHVYVTGPSAVVNDELVSINQSILLIIGASAVLVFALMVWVYRSLVTVVVPLLTVGMGLAVARPIVAWLGDHGVIGVSIFASSLLAVIVLGAGTDYGIFLLGRYQEARRAGEDPESAYYTALRGTTHIILASGLTVAGATACMTFTRLAIFSTSGLPCTIAISVTLVAALTLGPALLAVGSRLGFLEPRAKSSVRRWRRIATAVVRWPVPVLAASLAALVLLILVLPSFRISYDERAAQPSDSPANVGFAAADRHFVPNTMAPSLLILESDHDMRNPADMVALAKLSNAILEVPGIRNVQSFTRPLGAPLEQASLPNQAGYIGDRITQLSGMLNERLRDVDSVFDSIGHLNTTIAGVRQALNSGTRGLNTVSSSSTQLQTEYSGLVSELDSIRSKTAPVKDLLGSLPNCHSVDVCQSVLDGFSVLAGADRFNGPLAGLNDGVRTASQSLPQLSAQLDDLANLIGTVQQTLTPLRSTIKLLVPQLTEITQFTGEVREAFKQGAPNEYFFLPSQAFTNPLFTRGMPLFFTPDGKTTRMILLPDVDGFGQDAMDVAARIVPASLQAIKTTSLAGSTVSTGGPGATLLNIEAFAREDFLVSVIAAFAFVFCVVVILLRSLVAALTVIGTVLLSYLAALGLSVLIWQHVLDHPLHWSVAPISFIFLVAVGADYNLLLAARFKEELPAGIKTGIIRSMANTGTVVTTAGLVFGLTMFAMLVGYAHNIAQIGTTVGIGLLIDTLVVRSFVIPAIATIAGHWFWWPDPPQWRRRVRS